MAVTMHTIFTISYVLLCGLVVLESLLLREALRGTVKLKRLYSGSARQPELVGPRTGVPIPDFSGPLLGTGETLSTAQMKGESTILLFVSPSQESSVGYRQLAAVIHALWHRMDGRIYLVCGGNEDACCKLADNFHVHGFAQSQVPIVLDENSQIARSFQIEATPAAVEVDEDLRIARYGSPISATAEENEETRHNHQDALATHQAADQFG